LGAPIPDIERRTTMILPDKVNILGVEYTILYFDNPAEVDPEKRKSLWGFADHWTRTIRIYDTGNRPAEDIFFVLVHEILHVVAELQHLGCLQAAANHDALDILALVLSDTFIRNGWLEVSRKE
jgi:hypothetical protein